MQEFPYGLEMDDFLLNFSRQEICIMCNDVFFWGCADAEPVENEKDRELLRKSLQDVKEIDELCSWGALLFVARKRQERPQGAFYKYLDVHDIKKGEPMQFNEEATAKMHELFNAAGPKRETGFGNPYEIGQYR